MKMNGQQARALIDRGTTHNLIPKDKANRDQRQKEILAASKPLTLQQNQSMSLQSAISAWSYKQEYGKA